MYAGESVERVRLVQGALQLAFTLAELSEILRVRDEGGAPCRRVLQMTEEKLLSLEQQIAALRQTQRYMRKLVQQWRKKVKGTPPGQKAHLLRSLAADPGTGVSAKNRKAFRRPTR